MTADSATGWHSEHASLFDDRYKKSKRFIERFNLWSALIARYSPKEGGTGFDIGCGSGVFTACLAEKNKRVIGIDGSDEMLKICRERKEKLGQHNVEFMNHDINVLDQTLNEFADIITCSSVLEYLDDLDKSLAVLASRLKPGGVLIFSLPNRSSLYRKWEAFYFGISGKPTYYKYVKNVCLLPDIEARMKKLNLTVLETAYYAETPLLSSVLRPLGLRKYSDTLFLLAVRKEK